MKTLNSEIHHKLETHCFLQLHSKRKTPIIEEDVMPLFIKDILASFSSVIVAVGAEHMPLFTKHVLASFSGVIVAVGAAQLLHFGA
jgi:hypothetical protein